MHGSMREFPDENIVMATPTMMHRGDKTNLQLNCPVFPDSSFLLECCWFNGSQLKLTFVECQFGLLVF